MAHPAAMMTVDAEARVPIATAQLVRFSMPGPTDDVLHAGGNYWLDLCLTPRPKNARGNFRGRWNPRRFERIGKVFLVPPQETLHVRSDGTSSQTSILCRLQPDSMNRWFGEDLRWTDRILAASLDVPDLNIRNLLLRLAGELRRPGFASASLVELIVAQLAIELRRYYGALAEPQRGGGLARWQLRLLEEQLAEFGPTPSLADLAALCRLSVRQLTRGFRASHGRSIGDYVAESRLEHARRLLAGDQSVKAIAYTLGFKSPSSFCYAFRHSTGETPRQFRQRILHAS